MRADSRQTDHCRCKSCRTHNIKMNNMKRLVNYIKNLFGADVRLRKWCIEQAVKAQDSNNLMSNPNYLSDAAKIEEYVRMTPKTLTYSSKFDKDGNPIFQ